ncbi:MAG TPA: hypothetical protein VG055_31870 [Planctomycetaceae bacterium]|nr:hypothetical protein [Planctomycetaceae bacterium]
MGHAAGKIRFPTRRKIVHNPQPAVAERIGEMGANKTGAARQQNGLPAQIHGVPRNVKRAVIRRPIVSSFASRHF